MIERTCKHATSARLPPSLSFPIATIRLQSTVTSDEEPCDVELELCAMCAGFFFEALRAAEQRGAVPVPIDKANTQGVV